MTPQADVVWESTSVFIVRLRWQATVDSVEREMYQVLRFDGPKIREIADHRTLGPATKTAKRFSAASAAA